jgi:hypothetical protein
VKKIEESKLNIPYSDDDIGNNDCYKLASWIEKTFDLKRQDGIDLGIFLKWKKF